METPSHWSSIRFGGELEGGTRLDFSSSSSRGRNGRMGHDQLFKDILRSFFREFLELFYPEVEARLDFETLRFLDKEVFTLPEGSSRKVDVLAELETGKGNRELVL